MAAKKNGETRDPASKSSSSGEEALDQLTESNSSLRDFMSAQLRQQEKESRQRDNIDPDKRDSFIARAVAESQRMNREIQKSKEKRDRLYTEFGESRFTQWRSEHSEEVLTSQESALVEESFQH